MLQQGNMNLPKQFIQNLSSLPLSHQQAILDGFLNASNRSIRKNTNYDFDIYNIDNISYNKDWDSFVFKDKIGDHPYHQCGAIYVQDSSAMQVVRSIPNLQDIVLDMCASPGGKSGQLCQLNNNGVVISNEIVKKRVTILRSNIERMGYKNCIITNKDIIGLTNICYAVVVDAPCSGEGMFRKNPDTINEWSLDNVYMCAERQKQILLNASKNVADGGYLIYSTCTFNLEENEKVVDDFLQNNHNFSLIDVPQNIQKLSYAGIVINNNNTLTKTRRIYPHDCGDGQYIAVMKKDGTYQSKKYNCKLNLPNKQEQQIINVFIKENLNFVPNIVKIGTHFFIRPQIDVPIKEQGLVTYGVTMGQIESNRFIPHHNLASSYGAEFKRICNLNINDKRLYDYLNGQEIECESLDNGWCSICVDNMPLGLGKVVNGKIKNHYPKGLRI